jgi:signal transduction histidine kinase/CheY-like chemotaxis protein
MVKNETILIIDDRQEDVKRLTTDILSSAGYRILVAVDGERGLQAALVQSPDLIIADVQAARLNGLQVLQRLREAGRDVPVILTTYHSSARTATQAFRYRVEDYIIKPYEPERVIESIERALEARRLRQERAQLADALTTAHRQIERYLQEANVLSSIGRSAAAVLDEDRLLARIVEAAVYVTGAEEGFLLLLDEDTGELYMRAARGFGEQYAREFRLEVSDSIAGEVLRTGKPLIVSSDRQGDLLKVKTGYLVKSLLHVPLKLGDSVIGVLSVDHMFEDRAFTDHECYLLSSLADYASIALAAARLRASLEDQATLRQPAAVDGERASRLRSYGDELQQRLEDGDALVADLREQLASLESWLDSVASHRRALSQLSDRAGARPLLPDSATLLPSAQGAWAMDAILEHMAEGVLVVDRADRIAMSNRTAEAILETVLVGRPVGEVCDDPRWIKTYQIVKAAALIEGDQPGSGLTGATTRLVVAGKMLHASFRAASASGDGPAGIVVLLSDMTAEREAQRAKDSFVSSISQELRTPTTSIVGYTDLLMGESVGRLESTQVKFLTHIRENAEKISLQLDGLVGLSGVDSRQLETRAEAISLSDVIKEATEALAPRLDEKQQQLRIQVEPGLPLVQADPDAIYHVLVNLLLNAHRCSPREAEIQLAANRVAPDENGYLALSVTDAGGGVAPEDVKKVFNRFYRSETRHVAGLGDPEMSLPLVKVLVEAHGGRLWMDSTPGTGSTFSVLLPIYSPASDRA